MNKKIAGLMLSLSIAIPSTFVLAGCGHTHSTIKVDAISATCETAGQSEYYTCECGMYFSDASATTPIDENSWIIEALTHVYEETDWYDNDHNHVKKMVCERDASHIKDNLPINVTSNTISNVINPEDLDDRNWSDYRLLLSAGNYDKLTIKTAGFVEGEGQTIDEPKYFKRDIGTLSLTGADNATTIINGFTINSGLSVVYKNPEDNSGGLDYYAYSQYDIDTLKFTNITFTDNVYIPSNYDEDYTNDAEIKINNIIFENCVFDFNDSISKNALHIISAQNAISNININNCEFKNISGSTNNAILIDTRTTDDINITIQGCTFSDSPYNAIQISGSGSNYTGNILINNNSITNTGNRAIRISSVGQGASITITNNTMVNASDNAGELCKLSSVHSTATIVVANNYWGAKTGTTAVKGAVVEGSDTILDVSPKTTN